MRCSTQRHYLLGEKNDFVFRLLSQKSNWTEDIVTGLMDKAHVHPKQSLDVCRKMACKFLWILKRSRTLWVPTQSCVDLTTTGAGLTNDEREMSVDDVRQMWAIEPVKIRKSRQVRRHFKNCGYEPCGKRYLAVRANQITCSRRCTVRLSRARVRLQSVIVDPLKIPIFKGFFEGYFSQLGSKRENTHTRPKTPVWQPQQ